MWGKKREAASRKLNAVNQLSSRRRLLSKILNAFSQGREFRQNSRTGQQAQEKNNRGNQK